jgi:hypothetical protein
VRQVVIEVSNLLSIHNGIETLLQPLPITEISTEPSYKDFDAAQAQRTTTESFSIQSMEAVPGPDLEDRRILLERIKGLNKLGIGIEPFVDGFLSIEENAKNGEENKLADAIESLGKQIDEQERKYKAAQEFHPIKKGAPVVQAASCEAPGPDSAWDKTSGEYPAEIAHNVLADDKKWMDYYKRRWYRNGHTPEEYPAYLKLVKFFGQTLRSANRIPEAEVYEKEAAAIMAKKKAQLAPKTSERTKTEA